MKELRYVVVVQSLSRAQLFATPWTAACQPSLCFTISQSLLNLMSFEPAVPSNHLVLCCPLLLLLSVFPSIRASLHQLAKDRSFSFSISSSNEYSGLISFRIDWFDLLAVQGTLKSLLPHHSSKASTLGHSDFFIMYSVINQQSQTKGEKKPPLLLRPLWLPTYLPSFIANLSISTVSAPILMKILIKFSISLFHLKPYLCGPTLASVLSNWVIHSQSSSYSACQ